MFPDALLKTTFVTAPTIRIREVDDGIELVNEPLGASCRARSSGALVIEYFRQPRLLATALEELDVDREIIAVLLSHAMVVDVDLLFTAPRSPIGREMTFSAFLAGRPQPADVLFGAASDNAAYGRAGARRGPTEIRTHWSLALWPGAEPPRPFQTARPDEDWAIIDLDFRRQYLGPIPQVIDLGDIRPIPGESVDSYGSRIRLVAALIQARGCRPVMLGGDHSTTAFVLDALLEIPRPFGVLHFDAHHDLMPLLPRFHFVTHANPFLRALASDSLVCLFQLGLRGVQPIYRSQLKRDPRIGCRTARELQHLRPEQAFEGVSDEIPYYLTFDIDCLDPTIAPETGTPLAGGLSYYQAMDLVDYAARRFDLLGWDIVEVSQREGKLNHAAIIAGQLAKTLILANANYQPLDSYLEEIAD